MMAIVGIAEIQLAIKKIDFFYYRKHVSERVNIFAMIRYRTYEQLTPVCDNVSVCRSEK